MGSKKWNYIIGDSIAAGVAISQQLSRSGEMGKLSSDQYGKSKVGAPPSEILDYIKDPAWKLEGSVVVLSTGYSNGGGSDTSKNWIKQQLQYLKDKGSKVYVLGISNNPKKNPKLEGGNTWLEKTSKDYGFTFCGGFEPSTDYIHPKNYGTYWNTNVQPKLSGLPDATISNNNSSSIQNTTEQVATDNTTPGTTGTQSTGTQSNPPAKTKFEYSITPINTKDWEDKQYDTPQDLVDDITGKMIFKVESGPGPVLGIGEVEIEKGLAVFKGLEFKDPGEYTIVITSTVNNINPVKLKIKVLEKPIESTEKEDDPKNKTEGSRPFIAQIDKPTIKIDDIKLKLTDNEDDNLSIASGVGIMPFVLYNFKLNGDTSQYAIKEKDITFLRLYHNEIVPEMEMIFVDSNNIFKDNTPTDDKKIRVFLNPKDSSLKPINLQFKIIEFDNMGGSKFRIIGKIDIPELYRIDYKSYLGTSTEALREICKKLEIGFNSNINKSDDLMSWRNVGDKYNDFVTDVIKHSYVSDKSFMRGFIDYYYCLNFVDVGKEMERDISNDTCIDSIFTPGGNNTEVKMILTNELSLKSNNSSRYFEEKKFENNSTSLNLMEGIRTKTKFYDKVKKMFLIFDVDGVTSDGSKSLILKGDENDKQSFDKSLVTSYTGKIDTDNVHKNYNYSKTQNKRNLKELNNIKMFVELPNPNYSIYLYQKVDVKYVNPSESPHNKDIINWRKTGDYIITEISYLWKNKKLTQLLTLSRKELGKNREEMKEPDKKPEKDTKTLDTPNPVTKKEEEENKGLDPNSIYTIGEKFIVRDNPADQSTAGGGGTMSRSYYRTFILEITGINPNGVDVTTKIKELIPNSDEYNKYVGEKLPEIPRSSIDITGTPEEEEEFKMMKEGLAVLPPITETVSTTTNDTNTSTETVSLSGKKMLIIGDSQSAIKGEKTDITYTYPNLLKPKLKEIGVELDVLAKGGMTTAWMLENLPNQLKSNKYDIVMIYGGGNDASNTSYEISLTPSASKKGKTTDTLSNFQKMVDMCIAQGAEVFINLGYKHEDPNFKGEGKFGNYTLMKPTKYQEKSEDWIPLIKRRFLLQELLPKAIKNVKKFIPVYDLQKNSSDGIHPSAAGHKIVFEKIYDEIFNKYYNGTIKKTVSTPNNNTNAVGSKTGSNVILIGGLDNRKGDLSISQQVEKLKSNTNGKTVVGFRYPASELNNALNAIAQNPDAYVVLFSAGCQHAASVSSKIKDKKKLFIVEPFGSSSNVKSAIQTAVSNGTPATNVIGGPTENRGNNVVAGFSPTPSGIDHWGALKYVGSKLA